MKNFIWSGVSVANLIPNFRCAVFHSVNTDMACTCFNGTNPILLQLLKDYKFYFTVITGARLAARCVHSPTLNCILSY